MNNLDETELIRRVTGGDRQAFTILYSRHLNNLYRFIYLFTKSREISEEIIQNVFVRIWTRRESLGTISNFKSYLYQAAKNQLFDEIRRQRAQDRLLTVIKSTAQESSEYSDEKLIYGQYFQIAQEAINLLPDKRKRIVELRTKDDLSLDEIAAKLLISKNVVKKQLYAGMGFIRKYLKKNAELINFLIPFLFFADDNTHLIL